MTITVKQVFFTILPDLVRPPILGDLAFSSCSISFCSSSSITKTTFTNYFTKNLHIYHKNLFQKISLQAKIAMFLIFRGFKDFHWTDGRKRFVECFAPRHLIPYEDTFTFCPFVTPTLNPLALHTSDLHAPPTMDLVAVTSPIPKKMRASFKRTNSLNKEAATCFWKSVIDEANNNKEIGFTEFVEQVKDNMNKRKSQGFTKKEDVDVVKILIDRLFENRGSTEEFRHILSLTAQTGNTEAVIRLIRSKLSVVGLGYNVVPCICLIKKSTAEIQTYFVSLCQPERTFSGFRCDLIKCVELAAYLFGIYDLRGLRIDIWGDGCEIGGLETTRFAFRVLSEKISCQSSSSVFCFASYRGKDSRFAMEQNLGPTVAGDQSSGWLYQKTSELSDRGVNLTYSGDTPFLLRLILGISCETNFE